MQTQSGLQPPLAQRWSRHLLQASDGGFCGYRLPPLPALFNTGNTLIVQATLGGDDLQLMLEETQMDAVSFAWEQIQT